MKKLKKLAPLLLAVLYVVTAYYMLSNKADKLEQYNTLVSHARGYAENGVVVDAMDAYKDALAIKPSVELCVEAGEVYIEDEDYYDAKRWYTNQLSSQYPDDARTYEFGIRVYLAQQKYEDVFECYDKFQDKELESEAVDELMADVLYKYDTAGQFDDVTVFSNSTDTAAVEYDGLWGYVDSTGASTIEYQFQTAGAFSDYATVSDEEGQFYYIDTSGNKKITPSQIEEANPEIGEITELKGIESGLLLIKGAKGWYYCAESGLKMQFGPFEDATIIGNGIGAVADKNGKWALISAEGSLVTDYIYDSVVSDEKGIVCRTDAVIVCQDGKYFLVDHTGAQIGDNTYSEAKAYNDGTYAAMKRDGQWYFVDTAGQEQSLGSFEEAESFSNGLAAVCKDGLWGFITDNGTVAIECQFKDAKPFAQSGSAFVKEENRWSLLMLYRYHH